LKLLHRLLLLSLVPSVFVLLVGFYSAHVAETCLRRSITASANTRATAILDELDREIHFRVSEWTAYTQSSAVRRALRDSNRELAARPGRERYIDHEDSLWRATPGVLANPMTRRLLGNELSADLRAMLLRIQQDYGYPVFGEAFITNRFGTNVVQSGRTTDFRQNDEDWWQRAFQRGVYLSDIEFDSSSEVYSTAICLRVDDDNGAPLGVMKAVLNIQGTFALLDRRSTMTQHGAASSLVLLSSARRLIHVAGASAPPLMDGSRYFRGVDLPVSSGPVTLERVDNVTGKRMLSTYVTSSCNNETSDLHWILLCEAEAAEAFRSIQELRGRILLIAALAMLLTGAYATGSAVSLSRRIANLSKVARALGRGEEAKADAGGSDELSRLAGSFNAMSESQRRTETMLRERTDSLEVQNRRLEDESAERRRAEAERDAIEIRLRHAQKLEAVGQLAAGIAHEINTPMQFVGDNTQFLSDVTKELLRLAETLRPLHEPHSEGMPARAQIEQAVKLISGMDLEYLSKEVPRAIEQSLDGIDRVTRIVGAMKSFSHPGVATKTGVDLNEAVRTTITVARNEWKYVADVVTDFDRDLPCVPCLAGEVNQVLLNLIVNAAHAIGEKVKTEPGTKGTITALKRVFKMCRCLYRSFRTYCSSVVPSIVTAIAGPAHGIMIAAQPATKAFVLFLLCCYRLCKGVASPQAPAPAPCLGSA
jgi:signal transduction histidine kinase